MVTGEDENSIGVYGNQVTDTAQSAAESAKDLLGESGE